MNLIETNKKGFCAVCGTKVLDEWYEETENIDGYLYKHFVCGKCGRAGEEVYNIKYEYEITNGWE